MKPSRTPRGNGTRRFPGLSAVAALAVACSGSGSGSAPPPPPPPLSDLAPVVTGGAPGVLAPATVVDFTLDGALFAGRNPDDVPTVSVARVRELFGAPVDGPGVSARVPVVWVDDHRQRVSIRVDAGVLPPGVYDASVRTAFGRSVTMSDAFLILPQPSVSVGPAEVDLCLNSPQRVSFTGENLWHRIGYIGALNWIDWKAPGVDYSAGGMGIGCRPVPFRLPGYQLCTGMESEVREYPELVHARASLDAAGVDPALAPVQDVWLARGRFVDPSGARSVVDGPIDLPVWDGLVPVGGRLQPSVTIDGARVAVQATGCAPSDVAPVLACTGLTATVPQGLAPGDHAIRVDAGGGCAGGGSLTLGGRPVITSVSPASVCVGSRDAVAICGEGFFTPVAEVGGVRFGSSYGSCISVTPSDAPLPVGEHAVVVENATSPPVRSDPATLTITPGPPVIGWPYPRVVYSGATRPVFVPVGAVTGVPVAAFLVSSAPPGLPVPVKPVPGGAEITFPALGGDGIYYVRIADESPCAAGSGESLRAWSDPVLVSSGFDAGADWQVLGTWSEVSGAAPATVWLDGEGVPGGAVAAARAAAGPDWYFTIRMDSYWRGALDLGAVSFDLRAGGAGAPSPAPQLVVRYSGYSVEHALAPPTPGTWTHQEVTFADPGGWIYRDASGTRPATRREILGTWPSRWDEGHLLVLGSWWSDAADAAIDNVHVELAR